MALKQEKQRAERQVVDETGALWRLSEMQVWDASGRGASSLIAAHERGFRRLWDFPANWADLGDAQLVELVTKPVRRLRPEAVLGSVPEKPAGEAAQ
jgi:hypothetical protein